MGSLTLVMTSFLLAVTLLLMTAELLDLGIEGCALQARPPQSQVGSGLAIVRDGTIGVTELQLRHPKVPARCEEGDDGGRWL